MKARACYWSDKKAWLVNVIVCDQEQYDSGPFDFGADYENGTLSRVLNSLIKIRDSIPKEYRDVASCGIDSVGGHEGEHYAHIQVGYMRPATEKEIAAALAEEKAKKKATEAQERAFYDKLKQRYGQ